MGGGEEGMTGMCWWFGKRGLEGGGFGRSRGRATFSAITEREREFVFGPLTRYETSGTKIFLFILFLGWRRRGYLLNGFGEQRDREDFYG